MLPSFYRYMESTRHLLLYRLESNYPLPAQLRLPHVQTLALLHCAPEAVERFLQPSLFPSLRRIHYLSRAPHNATLHQRFGVQAEWVFPALSGMPYPFYDCMIEGGWARREHGLLEQYIVRHKPVKMANKKDETWFDLYLSQRGIMDGEWYVGQQMAYLHKKHCDEFEVIYPMAQEDPFHRCHIPPPMETHAIVDMNLLTDGTSQGETIERAFCRTVLGV